jgi:hypothetical protein
MYTILATVLKLTIAIVVFSSHIGIVTAYTITESLNNITQAQSYVLSLTSAYLGLTLHLRYHEQVSSSRTNTAECSPLEPSKPAPSVFWLESITHNGQSSFLTGSAKSGYTVFRNVVKDFNADNTGCDCCDSKCYHK